MRGSPKALRYALGHLVLKALVLASRGFPLGLMRWAMGKLGVFAAKLAKKDCQRARSHLRLAFGQAIDCEATIRALAEHLGKLLAECLWLASADASEILAKTRFCGLEHLQTSLAAKKGVVLITGHCGNWEWMNLALQAACIPMTVAGRRLNDPYFDRFITRLRSRFGGEVVARGERAGQALVKALRRGRVVGLLIDQDIAAPGVFVPFFGHPAWTPTGAAVLALRTGSPIVCGFARRLASGIMEIAFTPSMQPRGEARNEEDVAKLTALLTQRIEHHIRGCPQQWVWFHQRWRRRPGPQDRVWSGEEKVESSL